MTEANISIDNTTGSIQTIKIIAGANGYLGPERRFHADQRHRRDLGVLRPLRASSSLTRASTLNGNSSLTVTGTQIGQLSTSGSLTGPESFAFNGSGLSSLLSPRHGLVPRS